MGTQQMKRIEPGFETTSDATFGITRRHLLHSMVAGSIVLPGILQELVASENHQPAGGPLTPKAPHFPAKAKHVIFLYMSGGVSHVDSFDPKPELNKRHGENNLLGSLWNIRRWGKSGIPATDLFPHISSVIDDICLIRSMKSDHLNHVESTLGIHTGSVSLPRPSIGSWVSYGLGTLNQNLPSFVVIAPKLPYAGTQVFSNDFLPAYHQGVRVRPGPKPIPNLSRRSTLAELQEMELGLAATFNKRHLDQCEADSNLAARIQSFETAFAMQQEAPEVFDVSKESDATLSLYGLERGQTEGFGWQCIVARRLVERGVRFIELVDSGASNNWDHHSNMSLHGPMAKNVDQPIAGLIKDLKQRGMFEDTLVVWTSEFGRTPQKESKTGRGHLPDAFCSWLAGAGVKRGFVYGATDEIGLNITEDECHVHDFHATILHLMGLDHERLTYRHAGQDFRLTDVHGRVVKDILV